MSSKGPKSRFTVVPWRDVAQFNRVYRDLYSSSLSRKRRAVEDICVWETRCHPSLPTAVEATLGIVRAQNQDMLYEADKTFCQEGEIKMLYSMALVRFVNLTLEHYQKAANKINLHHLATKNNIPIWLIDLRNEAVHEHCPSLSILRDGAEQALQYLEETYWAKEAALVKPKINFPSGKEEVIVDLLNQYKNLQFQRIECEKLTSELRRYLKAIMKKLASLIRWNKEQFLNTLVQPGNFISVEDIKRLIPKTGPFLAEDINLCLPDNVQRFWSLLLRKIHLNDLMPTFLEKLLLAQEKCKNRMCQKVAIAWVQQILMETSSKSSCHLAKCFLKKGMFLNFPGLIYACLKGCTPYSVELLSTIVAKMRNKEKYDNLFCLMALYQGHFIPKDSSSLKRKKDPEQEIVFSVEDVEEGLEEMRAKKMRSDENANIWYSPSVTMDFSNIPTGAVIKQETPGKNQDKQSSVDSSMESIKFGPSVDDDFIIVNKKDGEGTVKEEITQDIKTFSPTIRLENFDMVYRRPNE